MERVRAMVKLGRPLVLVAALFAYAVGLSLAYYDLGFIKWDLALLGLAILLIATLMGHYANEYADVDTDSITRRTMFSGGSGVLPARIVPRAWALYAAVGCMIVSLLLTATSIAYGVLASVVGLIVVIGVVGGWFYSMPPLRLERTWFGEIDNSLIGGFPMPLIAYACQTGYLTLESIIIMVPVFLAVLANLRGVHWPDRRADEAGGKRSLVVTLGDKVITAHWIIIIMTYVSVLAISPMLPQEVVLASMLTIPVGILAGLSLGKIKSPIFSSGMMAVLMIAMSVGWVLARGF
ncbi:MAG TPA: prenyltransferase [Methanomassiliicoccales archaeon]|nr:prenyltransferase [Methanomassiliicoccales archaeon]